MGLLNYNLWFIIIFFLGLVSFILGSYFLLWDEVLFLDWELITLNTSSVVMTLLFDWMSFIFMGCVLFISSMVIFYSGSYMSEDKYHFRFLVLVLLFILSMVLMIVSPNMISILLGWDGLGLVSYCLVIYFQNYKSYNAGMLTVLTNRVGDVAILLAISWLFNFGSWNYLYYLMYSLDWVIYVVMFVSLAAFTSSAQIPFSSWLPAAMAAPTPVSALVHSSTLVTAGVYLLIRFSDMIYLYNCYVLLLLSCLTMFMAGLAANFEYDLKKIIALSTLSQLGLMMCILFLGGASLSFLHLLSHAFFKALLFLCAGLIIHSMNNSQDIRFMGGLIFTLPYTCSCFCISSFSLCGVPFLSGFYSKDLILEEVSYGYSNLWIYLLLYISVGLTVSYSLRLIYYCLVNFSYLDNSISMSEDSKMMFSMIFLVLFSIMGGSLLLWLWLPVVSFVLLPLELKFYPFIFMILGGYIGYSSSSYSLGYSLLGVVYPLIFTFISSMWFLPNFSTYMVSKSVLVFSSFNLKFMDSGWGEFVISTTLSKFFYYVSSYMVFYHNSNIKLVMSMFLVFVLILLFLM